jgi:hypothetical protein
MLYRMLFHDTESSKVHGLWRELDVIWIKGHKLLESGDLLQDSKQRPLVMLFRPNEKFITTGPSMNT